MSNNSSVRYQCPSNIALVKYWGKKPTGLQLPANASISWTLSDLYADTTVTVVSKDQPRLTFLYDGQPKSSFEPKILDFIHRISEFSQFVYDHHFEVNSVNNFPHGTGIASSAAGFGALALCMVDLEGKCAPGTPEFFERASFFARLGSGSACRSVYDDPAIWGENLKIEGSNDHFAIPYKGVIHSELKGWRDCVLIVDAGEKQVSSTAGHALLKEHPYAQARYTHAQNSIVKLLTCFHDGDVITFIQLVESEALQLHAMMMSSIPYFTLVRPNTLAILEEIWKFRNETGHSLAFTLDAGANVHLLYPGNLETVVQNFIHTKLLVFCQNGLYLCSETGGKPKKIN